ncbi:MAG TPA: tRNA (5-methylaminomethyl-2-thiouridine)(34)-methyltransferase MnmD [Balneolaceae bacterium]|nr:tRNA (5-methylaminomethyl-2-thiouridine)(34)-methyltransferase MnmD [Balneolaceae bacterium]
MKQPEIHITKDGSSTLYSEEYNQFYHNPNGAVAESRHVYFEQSGLLDALAEKRSLSIFETGFGSGLNLALLKSYLEAQDITTEFHFFSVEASPLSAGQAGKIQFGENPELNSSRELLVEIFSRLNPGMNEFQLSRTLRATIYYGSFHQLFEEVSFEDSFDFFLHDPFSPGVNAELWTSGTFHHLASVASPDAMLSTYCAATPARAAMAVAGWKLCRKKGALGKREMTLASRSEKKLKSCKRLNEKRLAERYLQNEFGTE